MYFSSQSLHVVPFQRFVQLHLHPARVSPETLKARPVQLAATVHLSEQLPSGYVAKMSSHSLQSDAALPLYGHGHWLQSVPFHLLRHLHSQPSSWSPSTS